jgi:hypothetical protein
VQELLVDGNRITLGKTSRSQSYALRKSGALVVADELCLLWVQNRGLRRHMDSYSHPNQQHQKDGLHRPRCAAFLVFLF